MHIAIYFYNEISKRWTTSMEGNHDTAKVLVAAVASQGASACVWIVPGTYDVEG